MIELFVEMDRILRPEVLVHKNPVRASFSPCCDGANIILIILTVVCQGWVVLKDKVGPIEKARMLATQIRWEARVIDFQNGSDQRLLVCQKPFVKK